MSIASKELIERLASIEHERWSHWQRYMHEKGSMTEAGCLIIPADLVERWQRLMDTDYADLTEEEKQSDRDQVYRYLPTVIDALGKQSG